MTSVLLGGALFLSLPTHEKRLSFPDYKIHEKEDPAPTELQLTDVTLDWQVVAAHQQTDEQLSALTETLGSGICALDANRDGWMDLFLVGGSGHTRHYGRKSWWHLENGNRLLLNRGGTHFSDATGEAGLETSQWGMGCAVADFDNDGWPDLIVTGVDLNKVYRNTGAGVFADVTAESGIVAEPWSTGASLADYNNDALVDIYISNYVAFEKGARTFERNKGFIAGTVAFDATLYDPLPNKLYLNQGDFTFLETTEAAGVMDSLGRSLGAHWTDLNDDGWQDLIVINDVDSPSQVYINDRGKRFTLSQGDFSLLETPESRDLLEEDFNDDGHSEFLITQNSDAAPILATREPGVKGNYTDRAGTSGIADHNSIIAVNWGVASGDFNNDGNIDVFIANGGIMPDIDSPFVALAQHNELLLGLGGGRFLRQEKWQDSFQPQSSRAAISADLNNDGTPEIIVSNNNDPLQILEVSNAKEAPWIGIDLYQDNGFTQATGARVTVSFGEHTEQRTVRSRQGFLGSGDNRLLLALDNAVDHVAITVSWPDGTVSSFGGVPAGAYYVVKKAGNTLLPSAAVAGYERRFTASVENAEDSARVELGQLLRKIGTSESDRYFSQLWATSNDSVRERLLQGFGDNWQRRDLRYVRQSINSTSETLQLLAIEYLKSLELEQSIAWLIPMLRGKPDRVACAAANTLQFFFEEEEAVTHRKYLAVGPLVQLVQNGSALSAVCAADALAAAESKRAVLPLLANGTGASNEDVASASIRALGLIRDSSAIPVLAQIAGAPQNHAPSAVAESLIALKRLGDARIDSYTDQLFDPDNLASSAEELHAVRIANHLLANKESIVISRARLISMLERLLSRLPKDQIEATTNSTLAIESLASIKLAGLGSLQPIAERLAANDNPEVRRNAYEALVAVDSDWQKSALPQLLQQESTELVLAVLNSARRQGTTFNDNALRNLAGRLQSYGPMAAQLGPVLDSLSDSNARALLSMLYSQGLAADRLSAMLPLCEQHSAAISSALAALDLRQQAALEYLYLYCLFTPGEKKVAEAGNRLADRALLKKVTESEQFSEREKQQLLLRAAADDRVIAETMLLYSIDRYTGDDLLRAIEVLSQHQLEETITPFLWSLLADDTRPLAIRFAAAALLVHSRGDDVTEYVYSNFIEPDANS